MHHTSARPTRRNPARVTKRALLTPRPTPPPSDASDYSSDSTPVTTSNRRISKPILRQLTPGGKPTLKWHSNSQVVSDQKVQTTYSNRNPRTNTYRKMVTKTVTMTVTTTIATTEIVDGEEVCSVEEVVVKVEDPAGRA